MKELILSQPNDEKLRDAPLFLTHSSLECVQSLLENREDFRPFPCPKCDSTFKRGHHLTQHLWIHDGKKDYPCLYCELTFRRKTIRDRHEAYHRRDRCFECLKCCKTYITDNDLKQHMNYQHAEESEKLYKCDYPFCDKSFVLQCMLKAHRKRHPELPKRKIKMKKSLEIKTSQNNLPYLSCSICRKWYKSIKRLEKHQMNKKHFEIGSGSIKMEFIGAVRDEVEDDEIHECPVCLKCFRKITGLGKCLRKHEEEGIHL